MAPSPLASVTATIIIIIFVCMAITIVAKEICDNFSVNHMKIIECNNIGRKVLEVVRLEKDTDVDSLYVEGFMNGLMPTIVQTLRVPVVMRNYSLAFEEEVYDYSELFSRSGTMFSLRETQRNKTLIYDGQEFANHSYTDHGYVGLIILVESIHTLDEYLMGSVRPPFLSTHGLYTIFVMEQENNAKYIVGKVLEKLWRDYGILIAVIVFVCQDEIAYYLDQFHLNQNSYGVVKQVITGKNLTKICNKNTENYPVQFNGFPIRILMFEEDPMSIPWTRFPNSFRSSVLGKLYKYNPLTTGYNGLTVAGIVQALNFTPNYKFLNGSEEKYSYKKKGIIVGSGEVVYSKYDFVGVLHFMVGKEGFDYDYLTPILFDKYCIIAPKAKTLSLLEASLRSFTLHAWIVIMSIPWVLALFFKTTRFLGMYKEQGFKSAASVKVLCTFYKILFGQATFIQRFSQSERWLLAACMCFSIVFTTVFNATLTSHVTTELRYKDIETLEELANSGLKIVTSSAYMINVVFGEVEHTKDHIMKRLRSNFQLGRDSLLKTILGLSCCIRQALDYEITNMLTTSKYGEEKLNLISQCPSAYHTTFIVRKKWPYSQIFNKKISHLIEAGLVDFWKESSKSALDLRSAVIFHQSYKIRDIQLNLKSCLAFFLGLIVGVSLSTLVFIYEYFAGGCCQRTIITV